MCITNFINNLFINNFSTKKHQIEISSYHLDSILKEQLPEHKRFVLDGKYKVPHIDDLKKAIEETELDENEYLSQLYDCENFSMHFHSILALNYNINTCGVVISYRSGHAFNILVSHSGSKDSIQVHVFEPQNDNMWLPNIKKDQYIIENEIILI